MANLTVCLLKVSNSIRVDRHLRYPGILRSPCLDDDDGNGEGVLMRNATVMDAKITQIQGLTLVHFSAQVKRFLRGRWYI